MTSDSLRILVIDDDEVDRQAIRRLFSKSNTTYEVTMCDDAPAGLRLLKEGKFDAVLLDYLLPRSNGLEVLKHIEEHGIDIPVVILSGQADQRIAVELMRHGAADYLIKDGLRDERLSITVGNVVSAHRQEVSARRHAEALSKLATGTAGVVGKDYVHALVQQLAAAFYVRHAFLAELGDGLECSCLALWSDDGFLWPRRIRADAVPIATLLTAHGCVALDGVSLTFGEGLGNLSGNMSGIAVRDHRGHALGVLVLVHDQPLELDLKQQDLLALCAARAAAEIGRLRAEQALAERLRVEKEMARCACALLADADPTQTRTIALGHLLATTSGGTISLYDFVGTAADLALRLVAYARGQGHEQIPPPAVRSLIHPDLSRWYNDLSHGLMISSPVRLLLAEEQPLLYQQGVRSVLVIPLRSLESTIGILRIDHHTEEHRWTREEVALIRSGADLFTAYLQRNGNGITST